MSDRPFEPGAHWVAGTHCIHVSTPCHECAKRWAEERQAFQDKIRELTQQIKDHQAAFRVHAKATGEEILARECREKNWDQMIQSVNAYQVQLEKSERERQEWVDYCRTPVDSKEVEKICEALRRDQWMVEAVRKLYRATKAKP